MRYSVARARWLVLLVTAASTGCGLFGSDLCDPPLSNEHCGVSTGPSVGCGNGKLDPAEECDDKNLEDGDGCNHECIVVCNFDGIIGTKSQLNRHCYVHVAPEAGGFTWDAARAACQVLGADLVGFGEPGELDDPIFYKSPFEQMTDDWTGGNDAAKGDGSYEWVNGEPWSANINSRFKSPPVPGECVRIDGNTVLFSSAACDSTAVGALCEWTPPGLPITD